MHQPGAYGWQEPPRKPRRGFPLIAWAVILAVVAAVVATGMMGSREPQQNAPGSQSLDVFIMNLQAQYLVGAFKMLPQDGEMALQQAEGALDAGTVQQRVGFVALAAEVGGAEEGKAAMLDLLSLVNEHQPDLTPQQEQLLDVATRIYVRLDDETTGSDMLTGDEEDLLKSELGWLGELAITHAEPDQQALRDHVLAKAQSVAIAFIVAVIAAATVAFGGFIGLCVLIVLLAMRMTSLRLHRAFPDGGIYAETFALWIVTFLGMQLLADLVPFPPSVPPLLVPLILFFISLLALLWPVLRGISWSDVRKDIGWTSGRGVFAEVGAGLASYAMTLPLVCIGLIGTLVLMGVANAISPPDPNANPFGPSGFPAHPVIVEAARAGVTSKVLLILLAAVAAPIVEETMFRGVLYRTLRNSTGRWARFLSVVVSVAIVSLIFAMIHPQGIFAVPVLAALAAGINLTREWRDSLIASMVVHGTSNGLVMTLLLVLAAP